MITKEVTYEEFHRNNDLNAYVKYSSAEAFFSMCLE